MNENQTALFADGFGKPKYSHANTSSVIKKHLPFIPKITRGYRQSLLELIANELEYQVEEIREYVDGLTINTAKCTVAYRLNQEQLMMFMTPHLDKKKRKRL